MLGVPFDGIVSDMARQRLLDAPLQYRQPLHALGRNRICIVSVGIKRRCSRWHVHIRKRLTEIKEASRLLLGSGQDPEINLEIGEAAAGEVAGEAFLDRRRSDAVRRQSPAVAIAEQSDEKRPAASNLAKAYLENQQLAELRISIGSRRHT
jgi:hypothetical protein